MPARKLEESIYEVGAIDYQRRLFDELIPLPEGTSYNAFLIQGSKKTALIDTVDPNKSVELFKNLKSLDIKRIDYVISNHAEQDHSGSIPEILETFPEAFVVTNQKCKEFLIDLLQIPEEKFIVVKDGETFSLGDFTLKFIYFPWVHWPETMITFLIEKKILFSCDLFGSHRADSRLMLEKERENEIKEGAFRYFSEIMYPFRDNISNNLQKVLDLDIKIIAPSHGPVYANPEFIINCYKEWTSSKVKNKVVIPYISMHGSVETMVNYLVESLIAKSIEAVPFQLSVVDTGRLAMEVTDAATVIVGAPQVLGGMHPLAAYAVYLFNLLRTKTKFVSIIGSYGWGGKMVEQIQNMLYNLKAEVLTPVIAKGLPKEKDFQALNALADRIAEKHRSLNILI